MANQTTGNPIIYDTTTGASWTGTKKVLCAQWVEDAGADIGDNGDLVFVVNTTTVTISVQRGTTPDWGATIWEVNFPSGMNWTDFSLTTLTAGALIIWVA